MGMDPGVARGEGEGRLVKKASSSVTTGKNSESLFSVDEAGMYMILKTKYEKGLHAIPCFNI